jgi:quercetin dioxygenase-like cupin family protein
LDKGAQLGCRVNVISEKNRHAGARFDGPSWARYARMVMSRAYSPSELPKAESIRDHRQRTDLVNREFVGARFSKGDVIVYAPGDTAAPHIHPDADHVFYVLRGRGTAYADGQPHPVQAGDVIVIERGEEHRFENPHHEEFAFLELWLPAPVAQTIWTDPNGDC